MGLLLPHIRAIRIYGDMIEVKGTGSVNQVGGGIRGAVRGFSADSRYRMIRMMHTLKFTSVTFVTLTYPKEYPADGKVSKRHLAEFKRRVERKWGKIRGVWKLEFQKRGAPHYHILLLDNPFMEVKALCNLWCDVIHTQDENARKISVDVKLATGAGEKRLIMSYIAKYVGKITEDHEIEHAKSFGRWWGKWGIEDSEGATCYVTIDEATSLVNDALRYANPDSTWKPMDDTRCTIFGASMGSDRFGNYVQGRLDKLRRRRNDAHA